MILFYCMVNLCSLVTVGVYFVLVLAGKRGPRFGQFWKVHVFLPGKHNEEFVPSNAEQARLSRAGMGMFVIQL